MRHSSILCCLSAVMLMGCQAPSYQVQPTASPVPTSPAPSALPSFMPSVIPSPTATPVPQLIPQDLPSPRFSPPTGHCLPMCDRASIKGKLTDVHNQALVGARITASSLIIDFPYAEVTTTNAQGEFEFKVAPANVYLNLRAEKDGYEQHQRMIQLKSNLDALPELNRYEMTLLKQGNPDQNCFLCPGFGNLQGQISPSIKTSIQLRSLDTSIPYAETLESDENGNFHFDKAPATTRLSLSIETPGYESFKQELVLKEKKKGTDSLIALLIPKQEITLPIKISSPACGQAPTEIEIQADGLLIQRSLPANSELFKGAKIERRVKLSESQIRDLKTELKTLNVQSTQSPPTCPASQDQKHWEVSLSDGSHRDWQSSDPAQLKVQQTIQQLAQEAKPDTSFNQYTAPFWSVIAGECSGTPHLNYALSANGKLQSGPTVDRSGTVSPLKIRQLSPADAQRLVEMLQNIDPVKAYNAAMPPKEPVSDTADCRSIETLVMTVNGELRAIPWNGSRIYAQEPSSLAFYQWLTDFQKRMDLILSNS